MYLRSLRKISFAEGVVRSLLHEVFLVESCKRESLVVLYSTKSKVDQQARWVLRRLDSHPLRTAALNTLHYRSVDRRCTALLVYSIVEVDARSFGQTHGTGVGYRYKNKTNCGRGGTTRRHTAFFPTSLPAGGMKTGGPRQGEGITDQMIRSLRLSAGIMKHLGETAVPLCLFLLREFFFKRERVSCRGFGRVRIVGEGG